MKLLHIDTSILGGGSVSRELTAMIVKRFTDGGNVEVTYRDLTAEDVPHLTVASLPILRRRWLGSLTPPPWPCATRATACWRSSWPPTRS